jgi:hypothetical protein
MPPKSAAEVACAGSVTVAAGAVAEPDTELDAEAEADALDGGGVSVELTGAVPPVHAASVSTALSRATAATGRRAGTRPSSSTGLDGA